MNNDTNVQHIQVTEQDQNTRLDRWFKRYYPSLSHSMLQKLLRKKNIRVEGKRAEANQLLEAYQEIRIPPGLEQYKQQHKTKSSTKTYTENELNQLRTSIIYEDSELLVINKPSGLAVQGGSNIETNIDGMCRQLYANKDAQPKLVHRIDKDTSGLLILAKTSQIAAILTKAFREKTVHKTYLALVTSVPKPPQGQIDLPLAKQRHGKQEKMVVDNQEGKKALTQYQLLDQAGNKAALISLTPITGRTHQLRVHMAAINCPIVGDGKYGGKDAFIEGLSSTLHLHAWRINIPILDKQFEVDMPEHMKKDCELLFG